MYKELFSDPALKPDMVKIYPCTVIKGTELMKWMKSGKYKPYAQKKLFEGLIEMKTSTPRYARISRLVRDIPSGEIEAGNTITNLREMLKIEMGKRGLKCNCLRCREIGHQSIKTSKDLNIKTIQLFTDKYKTAGGDEYFLSFEDAKRQAVYAFLRLRVPSHKTTGKLEDKLPETKDTAFVRELHTYGQLVNVGSKQKTASQHKGMGKKLMKEAEKIAKKAGYKKIAVISGVGVRGYYRKLGYKKQGTYMVKSL